MRPGSITEPFDARTGYLLDNALLWQLGWGVWVLSAITFVGFLVALSRRVPETRIALVIGLAAAACDLVGDSIQMALPASAVDPERFLMLERVANVIGLVIANGLYSF